MLNPKVMTSDTFIGKWMLVDYNTKEKMTYDFMDDENVEVSFEGNHIKTKYVITVQESKTILEFQADTKKRSKFIVLNKTADFFLLCFPKDYGRAMIALKAQSNKIAWGWSKPFTVWMKQ